MASLIIRNLDDNVKTLLRARAAEHGRSMEEEARLILREAVSRKLSSRSFAEAVRSHFRPDSGVDLELPLRRPGREPPSFDWLSRIVCIGWHQCGFRANSWISPPSVKAWAGGLNVEEMFLSLISEAELRFGAAILPLGRRREMLILEIENMLRDVLKISCCHSIVRQRDNMRSSRLIAILLDIL